MQAKVKFDFKVQEVQEIDYLYINVIDLAEFRLREGSWTKLAKSLNLTALIN